MRKKKRVNCLCTEKPDDCVTIASGFSVWIILVLRNIITRIIHTDRRAISVSRRWELCAFIFLILLFAVLSARSIVAATLTCTINATNQCTGSFLPVLYIQNDSGYGYNNSHAQNTTNSTFARYNYTICCSSDDTLSTDCSDTTVLKLSNVTDAHVQFGNYSGTGIAYNVSICLSIDPGAISCTYQTNGNATCSTGYTCLGSMASDNVSVGNQTNSHIGACGEYATKICCTVNDAPVISGLILNSTNATNYTTENLTLFFTETDPESDAFYNITDWILNGRSIAVLNMPFDTNISSLANNAVRDYSTYENNGTLGDGVAANAPTWNISGKVGGYYDFDGDDYINITNTTSLNSISSQLTLAAWVKYSDIGVYRNVIIKMWDGSSTDMAFALRREGDTNKTFFDGNISGTRYTGATESAAASAGIWVFYAVTFNGTLISFYKNSVLQTTQAASGNIAAHSSHSLLIGASGNYSAMNGSLDEVAVFNRSLSTQQIAAMYTAGIENHSLQIIHFAETTKYDNWSAAVTPTDSAAEGITVTSYNLTILNSLPSVILSSPADGNRTTNRTVFFNWTSNDDDGDSITYQFNITCQPTPGSCGDNRIVNLTVLNYTISPELRWLDDYGNYYVWSVRANDSDGYGSWTAVRNLNVTSLILINATTDVVQFGSVDLFSFNDTTDDSPPPFVLQNDGNAYLNVTINASSLWTNAVSPTSYYQFKVDNVSSESGAFTWAQSVTSFTNMPVVPVIALAQFNYSDILDSAEIDIYLSTPSNEPPGKRSSIVTFTASLGAQP